MAADVVAIAVSAMGVVKFVVVIHKFGFAGSYFGLSVAYSF